MDRYILDSGIAMLCEEMSELIRHGIQNHDELDMLKDMAETIYYMDCIKSNQMNGSQDMRMYSQLGNNYRVDGYTQGNSYNYYDKNNYDANKMYDGNSNRSYITTPYMTMNRGYSGNNEDKKEIIQELHQIAQKTMNENTRAMVMDCISRMENM